MDKLVQHIKMDMPGIPKQGMYCYGEASLETNMEMQEPLKKLYKLENLVDTEDNIEEYCDILNDMMNAVELETRINRTNPKLAALRLAVNLLESICK